MTPHCISSSIHHLHGKRKLIDYLTVLRYNINRHEICMKGATAHKKKDNSILQKTDSVIVFQVMTQNKTGGKKSYIFCSTIPLENGGTLYSLRDVTPSEGNCVKRNLNLERVFDGKFLIKFSCRD